MTDYSNYTALVVDDMPLNRVLITKMLKPTHFKVFAVNGGQEALDFMAEKKTDIVLLDWMMPSPDGLEVLKRMRADDRMKKIPVIVVTAHVTQEDIPIVFEAGANDVVIKPIVMERLFSTIDKNMAEVIASAG